MAIALVGTIGAVSTGASGAAVTPAWGTSESRTVNNLLTLQVAVTGSATLPAAPSGWTVAKQQAGTSCSASVFFKVAAGADAAPTVAAVTSGIINARLAEFSGAETGPTVVLGSIGGVAGTTTPLVATNAAADQASGSLMVSAVALFNNAPHNNSNWNQTYNNGTDIEVTNSSTSTASHYGFSYAVTTANASADSDSFAFTTTGLTGVALALASFDVLVVVLGLEAESGVGGLLATARVTEIALEADAALAGLVTAGIVTEIALEADAALAGLVSAATVKEVALEADAALAGLVSAAIVTEIALEAEAALAGLVSTGTVTKVGLEAEAALAGLVSAATVKEIALEADSALSGLMGTAIVNELTAPSYAATAGMTVSATATQLAAVALAGGASLSATSFATVFGIVGESSGAGMEADATVDVIGVVGEAVGASMEADASVDILASVAQTASPGLTANGVVDVIGSVIQIVSPGLEADASVDIFASVAQTSSPGLTADAAVDILASVAQTVSPGLEADASVDIFASVAQTASPGLTADGVVDVIGSVVQIASPGLEADASVEILASVAQTASPGLIADAFVDVLASINQTASVDLEAFVGFNLFNISSQQPDFLPPTGGVAVDTNGAGVASVMSGTTLTWSHTLSSTATDIVVVVATGLQTVSPAGSALTCKIGTTSMTSMGAVWSNNTEIAGFVQVWALTSPPTGTQTITVTSTTAFSNPNNPGGGNSTSFTGGGGGYGTIATNFGSATPMSIAVASTSATNLCVCGFTSGTGSEVATSPGTLSFTVVAAGGQGSTDACLETQAATGSTVTMGASFTDDWWSAVGFEIKAASTAPAATLSATARLNVDIPVGATLAATAGMTVAATAGRAYPSLRAVATGSTGTSTTASTFTIAQPTGVAAGDICLLWVIISTTARTVTATGFATVTATSGNSQSLCLLTRTITGAESWPLTVTISGASGQRAAGVIYAAQNASGFSPTPSSSGQTNASSATLTVPGVTTVTNDNLLVWFGGSASASGAAPSTITVPAGMTARGSQVNSSATTAVNQGALAADVVQPTGGATGNQNGSLSTARVNGGVLVGLSPIPLAGAFAGAATAGMTVSIGTSVTGTVTLAGGATLTVPTVVTEVATVSMAATTGLTATAATATITGVVAMTATAHLTATPLGTAPTVTLSSATGMTVIAGSVHGPGYASVAADSTGAWANPSHATGTPDSSYAAWTAPSTTPFLATVDSGERFLRDQNGQPFFMVGDSAWGLSSNISTTDMGTYFSTRQSQGFNTVLAEFVTDTYSSISTTNAQTFDGINAFTGTVTGGYPDLSTPNSTYWARMDTMVSLAASYGMTMMMIPADCGNTHGDTYMIQACRANGHTKCVSFGNFLGNRYKNSPNVVWMHGNDYNSGSDDTYVAGIMQGIQAVAPGMLHTVEYSPGSVDSYSLQATSTWTTAIQIDQSYPGNNATASYQIEQTAYAATPTMPAFLGEGRYEGDSGVTNFLMRNQAYWTMLDGNIGGYLYGNVVTYQFATGWQSTLTSTAQTEFQYWASLFRGINWWTVIPDTSNTFLTGGFSSGAALSLGAVAPDGSLGVVYAVSTDPVINMSRMGGTTTARWYDPTTGTFASIGTFSNTGSQTFTRPAAHADTNRDYVLVLTATPAFLTSVHSSNRYLLDQTGQPFLLAADQSASVGVNLVPADMETYYAARRAQGFNADVLLLVNDAYYSGNNAQTFDGINAFTGTVGGFPDLSTPNPTYWARIDAAVSLAQKYGITLVMLPLVINNAAGNTFTWNMAAANGATACNTFGQFLGNRYKSYPNTIFWRHTDDYGANDDTIVGAVRDGIATAYPTSLHTVEYSPGSGVPSYSYEANTYWQGHTQINFVYPSTSNLAMWQIMQSAVAATSTQPAWVGEAIFQGSGGWSNLVLRNQSYWAMTTGMLAGIVYGDLFVTNFLNTGGGTWQARLVESTSTEYIYWASLFRGLNWWTLVPDTTNVFLTSGFSSGTGLATGAVTADGSLGVVYAINSNPVINMTKMRGTTTARWYDPTLGTFSSIGSFANTGSHTFTRPSAHADGNSDYVLVLTA